MSTLLFHLVWYNLKNTILAVAHKHAIIKITSVRMLFRLGLAPIQFLAKLPMSAKMTTNHGVNMYIRYLYHTRFSKIEQMIIAPRMFINAIVPPMQSLAPASIVKNCAKFKFVANVSHVAKKPMPFNGKMRIKYTSLLLKKKKNNHKNHQN